MRTALVLDVEGTLCPQSGFSPFGPLTEVGVILRPVLVAPALCAALTGLATRPEVVPVWLTSWTPEIRQSMRPPFPGHGWDQIELDHDLASRDTWPKWPALTAWLSRNPRITRVAWVDDDLSLESRCDLYTGALNQRGLDALTIAPTTEYGMTPRHLTRLEHWISQPDPSGR